MAPLLDCSGVSYTNAVEYPNHSLGRFFLLSVAVHLLLLLSWPKPSVRTPPQEPIPVSLLPVPPEERVKPTRIPRQAPTRPSKGPAIVARKSSPVIEERSLAPREIIPPKEPPRQEPPPQREPVQEKSISAERELPTLKELLPPPTWSSSAQRSSRSEGPVPLDTRNPQYITYFGSIKRAIELVWEYPQLALRYGLQGKLLMEFTILGNGDLEGARIIRSSGSNVLDEEALRAVSAAAPFGPIPPWIGKNRIEIIATFEYHDNRLNYRFMP
jgi:protein TonB